MLPVIRITAACARLLVASCCLSLGPLGCVLCSEEFPDLCLEVFNSCETKQGELLGQSTVELDLRNSAVRTYESAVGNLIADAFYYTANELSSSAKADAAIQNGGGIRAQTACGERDIIPVGPIYEGDINGILPFGNRLVVTEITGHDLRLGLEHSVDQLGLAGQAGQAGHFLQVSRLRFAVNCTQPAHSLDSNNKKIETLGSRIIEDSLEIRNSDGNWEPVVTDESRTYRIAMSSFLGGGNDGFLAFLKRVPGDNGSEVVSSEADPSKILYTVQKDGADLTDAQAVAHYIKNREQRIINPSIEGRLVLNSCVPGVE